MGVAKYDPVEVFAGCQFAAVSVADTGTEPPEHPEPVEVGVTILDGGTVGETSTWLIRPTRAISTWATRGHGITNREVAAAPALAEVAGEISVAIGDRTVLAHRGEHCHVLLAAALPDWDPPAVLDVRRLCAQAWPAVSQALGALVSTAKLTVPGSPGRARHDAPAVAQLFLAAAKRIQIPPVRLFDSAVVVHRRAG